MPEFKVGSELINFRVSVRALIVDRTDSRFLLVRNNNGLLILPGGRIEDHELEEILGFHDSTVTDEIIEARFNFFLDGLSIGPLERELEEEIGLSRKDLDALRNSPYLRLGKIFWGVEPNGKKSRIFAVDVVQGYTVRSRQDFYLQVDGKEITEYIWLNPIEMLPYLESIPKNTQMALHAFGRSLDVPRNYKRLFGQFEH